MHPLKKAMLELKNNAALNLKDSETSFDEVMKWESDEMQNNFFDAGVIYAINCLLDKME